MKHRIHTKCCPKAKTSKAVFLYVDEYDDGSQKPRWCMYAKNMVDMSGWIESTTGTYNKDGTVASVSKEKRYCKRPPEWMESALEISFCPFCGASPPQIRPRKNPPAKVRKITDGGYYCDTCKERLNACECHPPEHLWEINPDCNSAPPSGPCPQRSS
jgi:hypothetical protein